MSSLAGGVGDRNLAVLFRGTVQSGGPVTGVRVGACTDGKPRSRRQGHPLSRGGVACVVGTRAEAGTRDGSSAESKPSRPPSVSVSWEVSTCGMPRRRYCWR